MISIKDLTKLKKESSITLKSQLKHLTGFFIAIAAIAALFLINSYDGIHEAFIYLIVCAIIVILSVSLLHIQYLYYNAGTKIELFDNEIIIYYYRNGQEKTIKEGDIISIEKNVSYASAAGGRYMLPTDNYYYQKIRLKNGGCIIITSLLLQDFSLFPEKVIIKKKIIAIIT
jgi:hypothetical protein